MQGTLVVEGKYDDSQGTYEDTQPQTTCDLLRDLSMSLFYFLERELVLYTDGLSDRQMAQTSLMPSCQVEATEDARKSCPATAPISAIDSDLPAASLLGLPNFLLPSLHLFKCLILQIQAFQPLPQALLLFACDTGEQCSTLQPLAGGHEAQMLPLRNDSKSSQPENPGYIFGYIFASYLLFMSFDDVLNLTQTIFWCKQPSRNMHLALVLNDLKEVVGLPGHPVFPAHHGGASGIATQGLKTMSLSRGCLERGDDYPKCFIVGADNVGSKQMQQIRMSLRGKAVVLMGKNTMMRKAIRGHLENNPALEKLLPHIRGNVGFVFPKEDLTEIRDMLLANKVPAATLAVAIAPCEVTVPAQNTGLGPDKTSFFQALGITTKISRGTIEILSDVQLIKTGDKVGASEATLLNMLNISPFSFGLIIQQVFDNGSIYNPEVLDITEETLHSGFLEGVRNVASVCLQIGYPTVASVPHSIINGYKQVLALSVETDYTFPLAEKVKAFLADPSAFVAVVPVAAAATAAPAAAAAPAKVEAKEESEESDEDTGFGLFD
ncbi:60S acidic ribosomal protein P0-like [Suricata suricatta]|nr:60S acidic ribosomal protein P0-like [Suricata suricatta]